MDKVCIVGYGAIGPVHAIGLERTAHAELYAICDCDRERLKKGLEKYPDAVTYESFDEMLLDAEIDAVHICTPHYLHFEMAKKAVLAGKKVVIEKPVTMLPEEFDELLELCKNSPNKVCIMLQNRFCNCVKRLKEEAGRLGKLKGIFAALTWDRDMDYYAQDAWRGKLATEGGGVLINQAVHLLDMMMYIGGEAENVRASMSTKKLELEIEDTLDAFITFKNGARGCFYATNNYATNSPFRLEAVFENGTLRYEDKNLYLIKEGNIEKLEGDGYGFCGKNYWGLGHEMVIDSFYGGGEYPTIFDAEITMKTMFAIYEEARKNI